MKRRIAARLGAFRPRGLFAGGFGVLCGAARIFWEFFRDPDPRLGDLGGRLTMGILLSAALTIVISVDLTDRSLRAHKPTRDSVLHEFGSRS